LLLICRDGRRPHWTTEGPQTGNHAAIVWKQPVLGLDNALAGGVDFGHIDFDRNYFSVANATQFVDLDASNHGTFPTGTLSPQHHAAQADMKVPDNKSFLARRLTAAVQPPIPPLY